MKNENWRQELVDFINEKAQEYKDAPTDAYEYFNLMAQLARHEANHAKYSNALADLCVNKKLQETNHEDD